MSPATVWTKLAGTAGGDVWIEGFPTSPGTTIYPYLSDFVIAQQEFDGVIATPHTEMSMAATATTEATMAAATGWTEILL